MRTKEHGFTLIELMIVVAIIGILAAIALPMYGSHMARTQATEAFSVTAGLRTAVAQFYGENDRAPDDTEVATLYNGGLEGTYINDVALADGGIITVTFGSGRLNGETVVMTPNESTNQISGWDCSGGTVEERYLPEACR